MTWGAVAGAGISVAGSFLGGRSKAKAAKKATKAQTAAAKRQEAMVREFDARTQKQTEPYRQFGEGATTKLSDLLGIESANPEYSRAENDYNNAQSEYSRLLKTPSLPVSGGIDNRYEQNFGVLGALARQSNAKNSKTNTGNEALIADAKRRMDESRARLDGTARKSGRSSSFGNLLKSFTENDLKNDVVYNKGLQFGLNEGRKGLERRSLATGNFDSGAALKELTRYGNDYGETKAAGAQERFMGDKAFTFNSLTGGIQVGQNAVNTASNNSATSLNGMNSAIAGGGNARSAGAIARGENTGNMFSSIGNTLGGFDFNSLFNKSGNSGGGNASPGIRLSRSNVNSLWS